MKYNDFFGDESESGSVNGESNFNTNHRMNENGNNLNEDGDDDNIDEDDDDGEDINDSEIDLDDDTTMKRVRFVFNI